jgi:hypothetical protein
MIISRNTHQYIHTIISIDLSTLTNQLSDLWIDKLAIYELIDVYITISASQYRHRSFNVYPEKTRIILNLK